MTVTLEEARAAGGKKAILIFPESEYSDALNAYYIARDWLLSNGFCFHDSVASTLHSPEYLGKQAPSPIPSGWLDQPHWRLRVEINALDFHAVKDVERASLPVGASLTWEKL